MDQVRTHGSLVVRSVVYGRIPQSRGAAAAMTGALISGLRGESGRELQGRGVADAANMRVLHPNLDSLSLNVAGYPCAQHRRSYIHLWCMITIH